MNIKIENIIVSRDIGHEIDPEDLAAKLENAEYNAKKFPGLIFRLKSPNVIVLLFKSGKLVATNSRNLQEANSGLEKISEELKKAGVDIKDNTSSVHNIVASHSLNKTINLEDAKAVLDVDGEATYDPAEFPAVIFKDVEKAMAVMIFDNGKLVATGARNEGEIDVVMGNVIDILTESGVLEEA